jgi:Mrp family chromosome partitioning ATPase
VYHELNPASERSEGALAPYLRALRTYWPVVIGITIAAISASVAMVALRSPEYEATARMLITPLPQEDRTFLGVQLLRDSGDPTRTVQTAATLVKTAEAAELTSRKVGQSGGSVLSSISVKPEGQTNILDITATAGTAKGAATLANEFSKAALQVRRQSLQRQVAAIIDKIKAQPVAPTGEDASRLSQLQSIRDGDDPTLTISQLAAPPSAASGTAAWLVVALSVIAGFTLGSGAALLLGLLDRRIRDEDEIVRTYPLPVLARVAPFGTRSRRTEEVSPLSVPPRTREAFRSLVAQLDEEQDSRTIMVTSASSGDGKTMSSINLSFALAAEGREVILIDLDLRKPEVGRRLGIKPERDLSSVFSPNTSLTDILVRAPGLNSLKVVPAHIGDDAIEPLSRELPNILAQARALADYVVLDTPPLGEVSDALRVARHADKIIVVARLGNTNRVNLELMRDLLDRTGRIPAGVVVIGRTRALATGSYNYVPPVAEPRPRPLRRSAR